MLIYPVFVVPLQAMKMCRGVKLHIHSFENSKVYAGQWSAYLGNESLSYGAGSSPQSGWTRRRRENLLPLPGIEPRFLSHAYSVPPLSLYILCTYIQYNTYYPNVNHPKRQISEPTFSSFYVQTTKNQRLLHAIKYCVISIKYCILYVLYCIVMVTLS